MWTRPRRGQRSPAQPKRGFAGFGSMRKMLVLLAALAATACGPAAQTVRPAAIAAKPAPAAGLGNVIGSDAKTLAARFGAPVQDLSDGAVGKLQFAGTGCVLDAYLYGGKVTHIDARAPSGIDTDRAACVATLTR